MFIFLFFISCKSGNILIRKERVKGEIKNISDSKLIRSTEEKNIRFNTLFFKKFQANININGKTRSFKGNLFMRKDSVIIMSVLPVMGIELFRIKLVPDSIFILDRTHKKITVSNYDYLWKKFFVDINFNVIQSILLDQFFCYPSSDFDRNCIKKFKHYIRNDLYVLQSIKSGKYNRISKRNNYGDLIYHEFMIAPDIFKITKSNVYDYQNNTLLQIDYEDYIKLQEYVFPSVISFNGSRGNNDFSLKITFTDIEINGVSKISFRHSDKYKIEYTSK